MRRQQINSAFLEIKGIFHKESLFIFRHILTRFDPGYKSGDIYKKTLTKL